MSDNSISIQGKNAASEDGAAVAPESGNASQNFASALEGNIKNMVAQVPNRRNRVSLLHGWDFVRFRAGNSESFPIMPLSNFNGPVFEFNPNCYGLEHLENPVFAPFWLPMALAHLCKDLLAHELALDAIPEEKRTEAFKDAFVGAGWDSFRAEICKQCDMTMEELKRSARLPGCGFHNAVFYMTQGLYYDSGLDAAIEARQSGRPVLRSA